MKKVILSADGPMAVYLVPDQVAENLEEYCGEFCGWMWKNPDGRRTLLKKWYDGTWYARYDERDFIRYLNEWLFPEQPSRLVEQLGSCLEEPPEEYRNLPQHNF